MSTVDLPSGWAEVRLADVCAVNPRDPHPADDTEVSFVPMAAVSEVTGTIEQPEVRSTVDVKKGFTSFANDDVIFAKITPCMENGKSALARGLLNGRGYGSTEFVVLRSKGGIVPEFLHRYVRQESYRRDARATMQSGVGQARVPKDFIENTPLMLPPLPEQKRIVVHLDALQNRSRAAREALAEVPALLDLFRQSVLAAAFRGDLTAEWRAKNPDAEPASALLERVRRERVVRWQEAFPRKKYVAPRPIPENLPDLPVSWTWATTDELSFKLVDGVHHTPNYVADGVPFITVKNLTAGPGISFEHTKFLSSEDHEECFKRANPERGDVLITKDGTLGVVRVVETDRVFSIFVSVALIKPVLRGGGDYLALALSAPETRNRTVATGSGLLHLHLGDLRAAPVALAPLAEQAEIQRQVRRVFSDIDSLEASAVLQEQELDSLDQSILARAFRGELVEQDPNDEPASTLLARIRDQATATPAARRGRTRRSAG